MRAKPTNDFSSLIGGPVIPNDNVMILLEKTRNRVFYEISIVIAKKHSEHSGVGHLFSP